MRLEKIEFFVLLVALSGLTACDGSGKRDLRHERESASYRNAMADYQAGRLDAALKGFRKVCKEDPSNASARFQLACLLQDSGKNSLEAMCAFREYLFQMPDSDKADVARDRAALCEKEFALSLAGKYGLDGGSALMKEMELTRKRLAQAEARCTKLDRDFAQAMRRIGALQQENERLVQMIREDSDVASDKPKVEVDAKALLDKDAGDDQADRIKTSADAAALRMENETDDGDRDRLAKEAAALRGEDESVGGGDRDRLAKEAAALLAEDRLEAGEKASSVVPGQPKDAKTRRDAARTESKAAAKKEPLHETRPESYVVQDGDTLYKIAMRFYGTSSAWRKIRDANKAVITTDGRVNSGMEIRLP